MRKHITIIGGGIKGCAIAALLTCTEEFTVTLVSRDKIGDGATSTNHGRLHLGTSGWRNDDHELMARRREGSELMQKLPRILECKEEALYCFEAPADFNDFLKKCSKAGISPQIVEDYSTLKNSWINTQDFVAIAKLREFSFSPANVAGRLAMFCVEQGSSLYLGRKVTRVRDHSERLLVELEDSTRIAADFVINATSRWSNKIEPVLPKLEIGWQQWRILCVRAGILPELK